MDSGTQLIGTEAGLGYAIIGKRMGQQIAVSAVSGTVKYTILRLMLRPEEDYAKSALASRRMGESDQPDKDVYEGYTPETKNQEGLSETERDVMNWSDRKDATKYGGYMAREGSAFGSFPSHDDYGDEAMP